MARPEYVQSLVAAQIIRQLDRRKRDRSEHTFCDGHTDEALSLLLAIRAEWLVKERVVLPRAVCLVCGCGAEIGGEGLDERDLDAGRHA